MAEKNIFDECVGDFLSQNGITSAMLLSHDPAELIPVEVSNGVALDLYHFLCKHPQCTFHSFRRWMAILMGKWPIDKFPSTKALRQSVIRLSKRLTKFRKEPNSIVKAALIKSFFSEIYTLPKYVDVKSSNSSLESENELLKSHNIYLVSEISAKSKIIEKSRQKVKESQHKLYSLHRNNRKKILRRDEEIKSKKLEVAEKSKLVVHLEKKLVEADIQIQDLKKKMDRIRHRVTYWKEKYSNLNNLSEELQLKMELDGQKAQATLHEEISQLEQKNLELQDTVEELVSSEDVVTYQQGKYTDDVRACCYELLSLNVGVQNVKAVITTVLKNIAHKSVVRLPCRTTLCDMMIESLTVAQAQLGEELTKEESNYHTLQTDGTTKYGEHFATYDIVTNETVYHLGLRQIFSGSAQNTLDTLTEILDDLNLVSKELDGGSVSEKVLLKIKNTMSDRHSAEKLFSQLLQEYRSTILPDIVFGWDKMSPHEKIPLIRINNFYCGLHLLVGLADSAEAVLKAWEANVCEIGDQGRSSGTQRLVRTACKAFHHKGSEQAGCSLYFRTYCRSNGILKIPLAPFRGNRFNIIFYDAAGVYFLKSHMEKYLLYHHPSTLNRLLQAVLSDLRVPHFIAGIRALGIIDKVITGPFWRHLESSSVSILEMSDTYSKMKNKFEKWSKDAQVVMDKDDMLFPDFTNDDDAVAKVLFQSSADVMTQEILQLLFQSFAITLQRLVIDHLPGGVYNSVIDPQIIQETKSVPKTNVTPERDFAVLDRLMTQKPNATYIALESLLLYSHNKTATWLESKTIEEKKRLLHAARTLTSVHRANFRKRREEIELKRKEALLQKERERVRKQEKEIKEKEELTKKISFVGLWTTKDEVLAGLDSIMTKKAKKDALKLQISFRKKVLCQTSDDQTIFQFSHNRKVFTDTQLMQNLFKLLSLNYDHQALSIEDVQKDPDLLIYRRIEHQFNCDGKLTWYKGTVLSFDKETKEFRILYDNEDEEYKFPLLEDLEKGEIKILS